jgi:hypothetical protein
MTNHDTTDAGIEMEVSNLQLSKAVSQISSNWDGDSKVTEACSPRDQKAPGPMRWSDDGRRIEDNPEQPVKESSPMATSCDPGSQSTEDRELACSTQKSSSTFTDDGMRIDFRAG